MLNIVVGWDWCSAWGYMQSKQIPRWMDVKVGLWIAHSLKKLNWSRKSHIKASLDCLNYITNPWKFSLAKLSGIG